MDDRRAGDPGDRGDDDESDDEEQQNPDELQRRDGFVDDVVGFFAPGNDPEVWRDGWSPAVAQAQQSALRATPAGAWTGAGAVNMFIVQAEDDLIATPADAQALKAAFPDRVTVAILQKAGHAMLPEQPERLAELVLEGLSSVLA